MKATIQEFYQIKAELGQLVPPGFKVEFCYTYDPEAQKTLTEDKHIISVSIGKIRSGRSILWLIHIDNLEELEAFKEWKSFEPSPVAIAASEESLKTTNLVVQTGAIPQSSPVANFQQAIKSWVNDEIPALPDLNSLSYTLQSDGSVTVSRPIPHEEMDMKVGPEGGFPYSQEEIDAKFGTLHPLGKDIDRSESCRVLEKNPKPQFFHASDAMNEFQRILRSGTTSEKKQIMPEGWQP